MSSATARAARAKRSAETSPPGFRRYHRALSAQGEWAMDYDMNELAADARYDHIRVCLEHGGLYDHQPDPVTGRQQQCHDRVAGEPWEGFDVKEWIRLCDCCLAKPLRSGSRWSPFFCAQCQDGIRAAECGIPIGRHSLMNGVGPSGLDAMFDAIERLGVWKAQRVRAVSDASTDPSLADFLAHAVDPAVSLRDLLDWWARPTSARRTSSKPQAS